MKKFLRKAVRLLNKFIKHPDTKIGIPVVAGSYYIGYGTALAIFFSSAYPFLIISTPAIIWLAITIVQIGKQEDDKEHS